MDPAVKAVFDAYPAAVRARLLKLRALTLLDQLAQVPGIRVLGADEPTTPRIPLVAIQVPDLGLDAQTLARTLSDSAGILVSAGRHCAHPLHDALCVEATLRASAWIVHDEEDITRFVSALRGLIA